MTELSKKQHYETYMKSGEWKRKRKQFQAWIEKNQFPNGCWRCDDSGEKTIFHIHHRYYPDVLGTEPISSLSKLCEDCHNQLHRLHNRGKRETSLWTFSNSFIKNKRKKLSLIELPLDFFDFIPEMAESFLTAKEIKTTTLIKKKTDFLKCLSLTKGDKPCKNKATKHGLCNKHRPTRSKPHQQPRLAGEKR